MEHKSGLLSVAFAEAVKERREAANLSRAALARAAKLHQTYIGLLERGERSPNIDTAKAIAEALGTSLSTIVKQAESESLRKPKSKSS